MPCSDVRFSHAGIGRGEGRGEGGRRGAMWLAGRPSVRSPASAPSLFCAGDVARQCRAAVRVLIGWTATSMTKTFCMVIYVIIPRWSLARGQGQRQAILGIHRLSTR